MSVDGDHRSSMLHRICPCWNQSGNEEAEVDDVLTLTQLIKSLHVKKEGAFYKATEAKNEAYNCAQKDRRVEAMSHLQVYHTRMKIYEQMVAIHQKAVMLQDTVDMAHSVTNTHKVMSAEVAVVAQNAVSAEQIEELLDEWNRINTDVAEASDMLGEAELEHLQDDNPLWTEYDELCSLTTEELAASMPKAPTTAPKRAVKPQKTKTLV
jgi:hypothetical protein